MLQPIKDEADNETINGRKTMSQKSDILKGEREVWGENAVQLCADDCGRDAERGSCYCNECERKAFHQSPVVTSD
jgi:hypothetical protein